MGCPVGIGPEIIARYFSEAAIPTGIQPVIIGDLGVLVRVAAELKLAASFVTWQPGTPLPLNGIPVVQASSLSPDKLVWGCPDAATGMAMARYIETGVALTRQGIFQGLTTCPISKISLNDAGYLFSGHTEMLASLTKTSEYAMMMAGNKLKVTLVTIHRPLREVATVLSVEEIFRLIRISHTAMMIDFNILHPRIAVAGFNPHAGESGLFGDEEKRFIAPAIAYGKQQGLNVSGPFPPDTIYYKAALGEFDIVVSMYHDQGLIPFKLLHFEDGVNVTLGLPIVRTSVDHGTAYDIAGKGLAKHTSLAEAIRLAAVISTNRETFDDKTRKCI
ncbi:MAG: 4-hydroxythreonine-4-phosphate dehydrogenase PdxA [Proteobacteria bacterium]|nr:4-hydroxythreonine-4-phosphate dehydrogenase PdxA [Pseudomonadota bacterium]